MSLLRVDLGNTNLKYQLDDQQRITSVAYDRVSLADILERHWGGLPLTGVHLAMVAPEAVQKVLLDWLALRKIPYKVFQALPRQGRLINGYDDYSELGVDRWLAMVALSEYYPEGFVVVSCGTAITMDCVDRTGQHKGGIILPGIQLQLEALKASIESVQHVTINEYALKPGTSTSACVIAGILSAVKSLVEDYANVFRQNNRLAPLILTGGDAAMIGKLLTVSHEINQDLVIKGLVKSASSLEGQL